PFPDGSREAHITGTISNASAGRATIGMTMAALTKPDIVHPLITPPVDPAHLHGGLLLAGPEAPGPASGPARRARTRAASSPCSRRAAPTTGRRHPCAPRGAACSTDGQLTTLSS